MMNIVQGIIIDTFASLRNQNEEDEADLQNKCFVCGLDKSLFDKNERKNKRGFYFHIIREHSPWNYVFFISYL